MSISPSPSSRLVLSSPASSGRALLGWLALSTAFLLEPIGIAQQPPAPQTLAWNSPTTNQVLRLHRAMPLEATASSGLPVTFRVLGGPAFIHEGTVTATNVGSVSIVAEQAGNASFLPASLTRRFNRGSITATTVGTYNTAVSARGVVVRDSTAFVADDSGGLVILDVSDPAAPVFRGSWLAQAVTGLVLDGNYAYLADGPQGLQVIDIGDLTRPRRVASFPGRGAVVGLAKAGPLVVLAEGASGVEIIDVTDPARPVRMGVFTGATNARHVHMAGNLAFVANGRNGLQIVDLAAPASPSLLSQASHGNFAARVQVVRNFAWVASIAAGLEIYDVSQPAHPWFVGQTLVGTYVDALQVTGDLAFLCGSAGLRVVDVNDAFAPAWIGSLGTLQANDVQVERDLAYVAAGTSGLQILRLREGLVQTIDFTVPDMVASPEDGLVLSAFASSGLPVTFEVVSGPARVAGTELTFTGLGQVTVRARQDGDTQFLPTLRDRAITVGLAPVIEVQPQPVDVPIGAPFQLSVVASAPGPLSYRWYRNDGTMTSLTQPTLTGTMRSQDVGLYGVIVSNLSGSVTSRLVSVTAARPGCELAFQPRGAFAGLESGSAGSPARSQVRGHLAYVVNGHGSPLRVFDLSDPDRPVPIAQVSIPNGEAPFDVALIDDTALVAERVNDLGIYALDNPAAPVRVGSLALPGVFASSIVVRDRLAFVGNEDGGLIVLDVDDPRHPVVLGQANTAGNKANGVWVEGNRALVADWNFGLSVFDVSVPTAPRRIGSYRPTASETSVFAVSGSGPVAYLGDAWLGLSAVDFSNVAAPVRTSATGGRVWDVRAYGRYLLAADGSSGLVVLDITSVTNLASIGSYRGKGSTIGVRLWGNRLIKMGSYFQLLEVTFSSMPPVRTDSPETRRVPRDRSITLEAAAAGTEPFTYRWFRGGQAIAGATAATLTLDRFSEADVGDYSVEIVNAWGSITSPVARLLPAKPPQNILWIDPAPTERLYRGRAYRVEATAESGLPVTFAVAAGPASLTGGALVAWAPGPVTLRASVGGNDQFLATDSDRVLAILEPPRGLPASMRFGQDGRFRFQVQASPGTEFVVLSSEDLAQWREWTAMTATADLTEITDDAPDQQARFYRVEPK